MPTAPGCYCLTHRGRPLMAVAQLPLQEAAAIET